jgi:hypothetical protein
MIDDSEESVSSQRLGNLDGQFGVPIGILGL